MKHTPPAVQLLTVRVLARHRALGIERHVHDEYQAPKMALAGILRAKMAEVIPGPTSIWERQGGRELRTEELPSRPWARVVACLNIWDDRAAIEQTLPRWYDHVDHVIAVDGAYRTTGARRCASQDGSLEYLRRFPKCEIVEAPLDGFWPDQNAKRNAYLARLLPGDLAFVIDADEFVTGAERLRTLPAFDVGWIRVESPLYQRAYGQPRLFRAHPEIRYQGRHHWMYRGHELLTTHQYGGVGVHAVVPLQLRNQRGLGHDVTRAKAKSRHVMAQSTKERALESCAAGATSDRKIGKREALRIVHVAKYDAGLAVSRLHTALNATTPHASVLFRGREGGPYGAPTQHLLEEEILLATAVREADVIHCHLTLASLSKDQLRAAKWVVLHHHGSMYRAAPAYHVALAEHYRALVLVSNLELLQYGRATWLPNPVPVARYRQLRAQAFRPGKVFRIAHSPSKREYKGTADFLEVCERLRARGVPVEPVLIEGRAHGEALALKATCDATFDSFWLGLQCSGAEAGAMGMPVIAGDDTCRTAYTEMLGAVPYTFANDATALEDAIVQLARDEEFRGVEAERVARYVSQWHDESAVALQYLDLLDDAFGWRTSLAGGTSEPRKPRTPRKPQPATPEPPPAEAPAGEPIRRPAAEPVETR